MLTPGFRPKRAGDEPAAFHVTAIITMEPIDGGTGYRAHVMHEDAEVREEHRTMGFYEGWGAALDQLVNLMMVWN